MSRYSTPQQKKPSSCLSLPVDFIANSFFFRFIIHQYLIWMDWVSDYTKIKIEKNVETATATTMKINNVKGSSDKEKRAKKHVPSHGAPSRFNRLKKSERNRSIWSGVGERNSAFGKPMSFLKCGNLCRLGVRARKNAITRNPKSN